MTAAAHRLILTALLVCTAAARADVLTDREQAYLSEKGELVFVAQPQHAPFDFVRKKQVAGMNVELVQWMAADLGFKVRFETAPLEEALKMVSEGTADAVTSLFFSEDRDGEFDFSETIKLTPVALFVRSNRDGIRKLSDLEGLKVAIVGSGRAMEELQQHGIRCQIKYLATTEECIQQLLAGDIDAMIGNELVTQHYLYTDRQTGLKITGNPLFAARLCMAVKAGNRELLGILNKGLGRARKTGTMNRIQAKWLGAEYADKRISLPTFLTIAALCTSAAALIIALILLWNRRLQNRVTEQMGQYAESEERLRRIFENSPDAVFVMDREGRILSANARASEMVKMRREELLSKTVYDLAPPVFHDEVSDNMRQWFSGDLDKCEGACQASDGSICPIEMTGTLQHLDGRKVLQLHVRDITLRKEAEDKLHAAKAMAEDAKDMAVRAREIAEKASQAKSEFLANMSHEIRTPLNGIVGMAQLLADTPLNREQANCLETIQQSTCGLLKIINHVLDISKIEAGQMDVRESPVDLREMCKTLQDLFKPQADQNGIALTCSCQESVPLYVMGDEGLIEQVLVNLLGNALKFTHNGSVTLNIECHKRGPQGAELYFQVIDTGIGIAKDKQQTIFEKFTQADGSAKRLYGGTGLGLAITKKLVELMGGEIGLISTPGKGATFFFNLTLALSAHAAPIKVPEPGKTKTVTTSDIRILLVEDNLVNQKVATAILKKAGCQVDTADNGQDGVQRVRQTHYDVVLMDCQMPIMDGFEATARIRAMHGPVSRIPIIAITAHAMKDDKQKCIDSGMDDYIAKPVNRQALIDIINKYTSAL